MLEKSLQKENVAPELLLRGQAALAHARNMTRGVDCLIGVDPRELRQIRREIGVILDQLTRGR